jgi:hypothetical protein
MEMSALEKGFTTTVVEKSMQAIGSKTNYTGAALTFFLMENNMKVKLC